ncbi:hypothetical protein HMPREF3190_00683 [Umbribacter vaginalis]|nr:hypothetical protein HMPREF3190_00683 [Coriobacteriales bacterium DNF00809]
MSDTCTERLSCVFYLQFLQTMQMYVHGAVCGLRACCIASRSICYLHLTK